MVLINNVGKKFVFSQMKKSIFQILGQRVFFFMEVILNQLIFLFLGSNIMTGLCYMKNHQRIISCFPWERKNKS
ncbi:hypothetical protein X975_05784, partial [Stegodyphus mimosarum]